MERIEGTVIEEEATMEQNLVVRGVAFEDEITKISVLGLTDSLTSLSTIFTTLAQNQINVDIIIQSTTEMGNANLAFSIKSDDLQETISVLEDHKELLGYEQLSAENKLAKVSIVGSGMISNPGVAAKMFEVLATNKIPIKMVSTSEIKVSAVVEERNMIRAVEVLHDAFELANIEAEVN
jgi:aspartate kinase